MTNEFILERVLAGQLGLSAEQIRLLRRVLLDYGSDFKKIGRDIQIGPSGEKKLRAALELENAPEKKEAPGAEDAAHRVETPKVEPVTLYCLALLTNPRVIYATALDPKEWPANRQQIPYVTVRVRSSENFRTRMHLKAVPCERPGVFDLLGRCPRFPGRY